MSKTEILKILKKYQESGSNSALRRSYLASFQKLMIYRTSKSERPEVTKQMVEKILSR